MEQTNTGAQAAPATRSGLLSTLCILTWVGSGLGALAYLFLAVAAGAMGSLLEKIPGMSALLGAGVVVGLLLFVLSVGKIFGAVQMWKMKKTGFFIYAICEVVALGIGAWMSMKGNAGFPIMGIVFTGLFIGLYGMNLKNFK
jgi:hypothetical protein